MRGTPRLASAFRPACRFIPAYAGNTACCPDLSASFSVHPRVCGEHPRLASYMPMMAGSSPRMRGTQRGDHDFGKRTRFIPAYAGNTGDPFVGLTGAPVHPRVCGEHPFNNARIHSTGGSSPRMRGTRRLSCLLLWQPRFIPAYAGNTINQSRPQHALAVHPRVCGEHECLRMNRLESSGSSPRMRGTQSKRLNVTERGRFIPAYAGNTYSFCHQESPYAVHPRVCGEHPPCFLIHAFTRGSSPRMR